MKKTLITIALTAVVVLTLVGLVSGPRVSNTFSSISSALPGAGFGGGGGGAPFLFAEAPALPADVVVSKEVILESGVVNQTAADPNRLVIRNADLTVVVTDPKEKMAEISKLAEEMGGYVVTSNLSKVVVGANFIEVPQAYIMIRVPADQLDDALAAVKTGAVDVPYENTSSQDVTSEYVDLQSRLKAKQDAEKQLLKIMEKAEKVEDVRAIYMDIQTIQTEIEVLKGQIKYYEESAALSAINITLVAEAGTQPLAVGPWKPEGAAKEAIQDLIYFFQNFVDFLIRFMLLTLPSLILIAIPLVLVFFGGRALFRRFVRSTVKVEVKEEAKK